MVKKLHDPDLSKQLQKIKIMNKWSNGNTLNYIKQAGVAQIIKYFQYLCDKHRLYDAEFLQSTGY